MSKVDTFREVRPCFSSEAVCNLAAPVFRAKGDLTVFCPNCGTKNDDSVQKCTQCGFDQKTKAAAPNFKGTMMLKGTAPQAAGAPSGEAARPKPNLKGTMVGVAPPGIEELRKQAASASAAARPNPNLKGTMVGVAPPGMEDLRKQAAQAASPTPASPTPAGPTVGSASAVAKRPPSNLKGTMIGIAPPDNGELEAAKAKLAAQKAAKAQGAAVSQGAAPGTAAPVVQDAKTPAASPSAAGAAHKSPPSQLKGTMIGVAPPDMQAQLSAAKAQYEKKTAAAANAGKPEVDNDPPSAPDPLGGTMVGMSPFVGSTPAPVPAAESSLPTAGTLDGVSTATEGSAQRSPGDDFSEDTPAAPSEQKEVARLSSAGSDPGAYSPAPSASMDRAHVPQPGRIPVTKPSMGPIILMVGLLLAIAAAVVVLMNNKGDDSSKEDEKSSEEEEQKTEAEK